jgi:NAD(P)-dependent dehydrogenase (short-subunit alcohol dehydrogenase family)
MSGYIDAAFNLNGRVAALTGAGGHLIGEISRGLARAGVRTAIIDSRIEKAEHVANDIVKAGGEALPIAFDVRDKEGYADALQRILSTFGQLDYVVNGAGINASTPFLEISLDGWRDVIDVQLTGTMLGCQVFGGHLVAQKRGAIINISSASAGPPLSKAFAYSAAKAAIKNLSQNLAREWAMSNVRVNILRPGFFPTDWNRKNFITPERERAILGHTPMQRYGEPVELVGAALWLLGDMASFVTGAEIAVDGGFSAMTI